MSDDLPVVKLDLWREDAIVLFWWLSTVDLNTVPISQPAEKQALMDLYSRLEESVIADSTPKDLARAQAAVARDMGW
jgi:hypothetical protein